MTDHDLTQQQLDALAWIAAYKRDHLFAPTSRDLAIAFDVSGGRGYQIMDALRRKKMLTTTPDVARSAVLTPAGEALVAQLAATEASA